MRIILIDTMQISSQDTDSIQREFKTLNESDVIPPPTLRLARFRWRPNLILQYEWPEYQT